MKKTLLGALLAGTMTVSMMVPSMIHADEVRETESEQTVQSMAVSSVGIENGIMTIRIDSEEKDNDYSWQYEPAENEEASPLELITDSTQDGHAYVGSFRAADGCEDTEDTIRLIHTDGFCTDQYMDFDVRIEDGMIAENTGGSHALPVPAEDLARALEGTWQEKLEGITMLSIAPRTGSGLEMVMSDGSGRDGKTSFYTMTAHYDAIKEALVYNNGTLHEDAAITDGSGEQTESDAAQGSGAGMLELVLSQDGESVTEIDWTNSEGGAVVFVRASE